MNGFYFVRKLWTGIVFTLTGLLLVVLSIFSVYVTNSYDGTAKATISNITETQEFVDYGNETVLETVYHQFITYEIDGVKYENVEFGNCDKSVKIGDTVDIVYDTDDPSSISSASNSVPLVVGIAGGVAFIFGLVITIGNIIRKIR